MRMTDDPSKMNRFIVMNGLRKAVSMDAVINYRDQQQLRRKVKKHLIPETIEYIVVDSASKEFQPNTHGELSPLIRYADFDELLEKLNTSKSDVIDNFEKLFDINSTWAFLYMKYPRKFGYLLEKIP